ncbi:hypothetical protein [Klebsiella pneumoniae IS46]|nr:hypothetical protein [Klebsiella pneumoniae IS46]
MAILASSSTEKLIAAPLSFLTIRIVISTILTIVILTTTKNQKN